MAAAANSLQKCDLPLDPDTESLDHKRKHAPHRILHPDPLRTNLSYNYDLTAWVHFHHLIKLVRKHESPCQSLRKTVTRRFHVARYHSYRLEKRGQVDESQPYQAFMAGLEDVRVKMDVCLDRLGTIREGTGWLTKGIDQMGMDIARITGREDRGAGERKGGRRVSNSDVERVQNAVGWLSRDTRGGYNAERQVTGARILADVLSRARDAEWVEEAVARR